MTADKVFVAVAAKTLSAVEVDPGSSHQHELAAGTLHRLLVDYTLMATGQDRAEIPVRLLRLTDDEDPESVEDRITVYDARRQQLYRGPEWRAYYGYGSPAEQLVHTMREGDHMVYGIDCSGDAHVLLAEAGSQWSRVLEEALAIGDSPRLMRVDEYELSTAQHRSPIALIADALGITTPDRSDADWLLERFGGAMPATFPDPSTMASLAHERVGIDPREANADDIIERWLTTETELFRLFERAEGEQRIAGCTTFDEHVSTALSILQRRKSRRGRSLEIHLEALFAARGLPYERQVETEPGSTSDFILPGLSAYRALDAAHSEDVGVLHLGAKSTARERWKQVLSEAKRLRRRHLATLDPQLSKASLASMREKDVVPVMPERLRTMYDDPAVINMEAFIARATWVINRA